MLISAVLFFVSALGCAVPQNLVQFLVFRFIGGLAIGSASIVSPLYISEIAPPRSAAPWSRSTSWPSSPAF